ncbi:MAG: hypothetical protein K8T26_13580 [Lentisphaerae bacterium]|nr:hypothetical protein [Lentisphaerota bacterium]
MLTRRERLMRTLRGEPVDRPAVNFYEIGGFRVDPNDADPFNIYNAPDWQPLLRLAEDHTEIIRLMSAVRAQSHVAWEATGGDIGRTSTVEEGDHRFTRTTLKVGGRTLTSCTRRDREVDTVWTIEHLLKDTADLDAYLQLPDDYLRTTVSLSPLLEEEQRLGDRGIVMVDTEDPLCAAATLFDMQDYILVAYSEPERFHKLLEKHAALIYARTEQVAREFPGRLWRIYGPEYASEPYLQPKFFAEYVVRYVEPMVRMIQKHGGFVRLHCHGRLKHILDLIAGMGVDAIDPIEPPPHGDVELSDVRARYGRQLVLFGNIEIADIEGLPPPQFEAVVRRALLEGTRGEGRGFVLMPSSSPYGRTIHPDVLRNYETLVRLVGA